MRAGYLLGFLLVILATFPLPQQSRAAEATMVAEGRYLMADGDTLAGAEEKVLQRAKRSAVEQAGMYLESTFYDVEQAAGDTGFQVSSLERYEVAGRPAWKEKIRHARDEFAGAASLQ